jgi:pimeloyl-ACP methyl ester carboxylesterase
MKVINLKINNIKTQYCKTGTGKALIVLPPWRTDIERLSDAFEFLKKHYCVYFLNVPGYGNKSEFNKEHSMQNYAKFIRAWMKKLNFKKADILGISMGGPIAYYILKSEREKIIDKVILLAPWYNIKAVNYPQFFVKGIKNIAQISSRYPVTKFFEKIFCNEKIMLAYMWLISPKENFKEIKNMKKYVNNFKGFAGKATFESMYYLLGTDLENESQKILNKTVFIMSKNDHQINYEKTLKGYKRLFPKLVEIPLTHKFHAPRTWITKKIISDYFGKAFEKASEV